MSFTRINGVLHAEQCSLDQLAQQYGTPLYVYSKATLENIIWIWIVLLILLIIKSVLQ